MADVGVAILADAFVVRCATIGATAPAPSRRRARFCPSSVDVFAWPMDQYGLSNRWAIPPYPRKPLSLQGPHNCQGAVDCKN